MQLAGSLAQQLMESVGSFLSVWREIVCHRRGLLPSHSVQGAVLEDTHAINYLLCWRESLTCTGLVPQSSSVVG